MKKLKNFGLNTLYTLIVALIGVLLFTTDLLPLAQETTAFGLLVSLIMWVFLYFGTYIIGYERKSTFVSVIGAIFSWIGIGIGALGCLIILISHGTEFGDYASNGVIINPFLNAFSTMWLFVALFSVCAYGLIQEERDYERGILRIPAASLVVGYAVALVFSFLGLIADFFYTWFFLILMGAIIVLLIVFRDHIPDRLPPLALLCKEIKLPGKGGKKSKGGRSTATYSAPVSSSASSGRSAQDIVSGLGRSGSSASSTAPTSSRPASSSGSSGSSSGIKKPTSSGSSSNNIGGNLGKLK